MSHHHHRTEQHTAHCGGAHAGHRHGHEQGEQTDHHCQHGHHHHHDHHGHHHGHHHHGGCCEKGLLAAASGMGRRGRHHGHGMGGHGDHFDRHSFGGGRRLSSEDLQLIVLALLEQKPRHGYEVIKALELHTHGFYVPSPGMVYPILTYLEESDLATVTAEGNKKLYTITEQGKATLEENREQAEAMLGRLEQAGQRMQKMQQMYAEENEEGVKGDPFHEAIHALRAALHGKRFAPAEEKLRITEILQRALKEL